MDELYFLVFLVLQLCPWCNGVTLERKHGKVYCAGSGSQLRSPGQLGPGKVGLINICGFERQDVMKLFFKSYFFPPSEKAPRDSK